MKICEWCRLELGAGLRRDARFCSQRCRQASHRFTRIAVAREHSSSPLRLAYADPPYPGRSGLYRGHPDYAGEVDHTQLAEQLVTDFPDGWALSTDARSLPYVLSCFAGVDVSVAAWFRRRRPSSTARRPVASWEPVLYAGGRLEPTDPCRYDSLICRSGPRLTDPARVIGAKPAGFAYWMFDLLGALPGDELVDLFPGSGGIGRAWSHYSSLDLSLGDRRDPSLLQELDPSLVDDNAGSKEILLEGLHPVTNCG